MRALGWFLLAIAGTLLFAALVAYPVHQLAMVIDSGWRFPRIVSRFWQLSMLAGIALCVWRLGLRGLPDWGYGLPRATFLRQFGLGLAAGIATMLPMALAIVALGLRAPRPEFGLELLLQGLAGGALTGLAVALVEESFPRPDVHRGAARIRPAAGVGVNCAALLGDPFPGPRQGAGRDRLGQRA